MTIERRIIICQSNYVFLSFRVALRVFSRANLLWEPKASLIACIRSASLRTLAAYASGSTLFFFMSHSMTQIWIQSTNANFRLVSVVDSLKGHGFSRAVKSLYFCHPDRGRRGDRAEGPAVSVRCKSQKQIPRRLKSARDDKKEGLPTARPKGAPLQSGMRPTFSAAREAVSLQSVRSS